MKQSGQNEPYVTRKFVSSDDKTSIQKDTQSFKPQSNALAFENIMKKADERLR
jgi:hypothetical protein